MNECARIVAWATKLQPFSKANLAVPADALLTALENMRQALQVALRSP